MKPIGDGSKRSGKYTGLGIAQQFSNAVVHFLHEHRLAKPHEGGGKELPIDQGVWHAILRLEYKPQARKTAQSLQAYCDYYNDGTHGHGYDQSGRWDCGTGKRRGKQRVGQSIKVKKRNKTVHPGSSPPFLKPMQVIALVRRRLGEIPTKQRRGADKLEAQSRQRRTSPKPAKMRKTKFQARGFVFADESAIEGVRREVRWFARTRNRPLRDRKLAKANGTCEACRRNYSKVLRGKGVRVLLVHHSRRQLSEYHARGQLTDERDLAVVCANCHMLLHIDPKHPMDVNILRKKLRGK